MYRERKKKSCLVLNWLQLCGTAAAAAIVLAGKKKKNYLCILIIKNGLIYKWTFKILGPSSHCLNGFKDGPGLYVLNPNFVEDFKTQIFKFEVKKK